MSKPGLSLPEQLILFKGTAAEQWKCPTDVALRVYWLYCHV